MRARVGDQIVDPSLASRVEGAIVAERRSFALSTSMERVEAGVLDIAGGCAVYTGHGLLSNQALLATPGLTALIAWADGEAAAASVFTDGSVAVLGGAATLPRHRRRGAHLAMIAARLELASTAGCDLAVVTADPRSISARNSERSGFDLVGTHAVLAAPGLPTGTDDDG